MAREAIPLQRLFDPDHLSLVAPLNMADEIQKLFVERGYSNTSDHGEIARSALESLAMRYRTCLESLESLLGYTIETIHIIGGGVQNDLLCQMTASATNRTVVAGPVEATAIGNIMSQCLGTGRLTSVVEARSWLRSDKAIRVYQPENPQEWDDAYTRFISS
jgi:rhamnulokinase